MNERIEQLAEQCWVHTNEPLFAAKSPHWEFDRQKFAGLIVKYCATICNTVSGDSVSNASKDYQEGREMGAIICRNQILKHFGIEE